MSTKFIPVRGCDSILESNGFRFRIASYTVLALSYALQKWFPYCLVSYLDWNTRSKSVLNVLKNLGSDFLCLQELEDVDFFDQNLRTRGYSCLYMKRSGNEHDGCAILYKNSFTELLMEDRINFNDLVNGVVDRKKENDLSDPLARLKRDCAGIVGAFKLKYPSNQVIIVATTHLYFNPKCADVKLKQAEYLLSRLEKFKKIVVEKFECVPHVFVAGDFNSVPSDNVYRHISSSMKSVHEVTVGEPAFTNFTDKFSGTLDYIFFSPSKCVKPVSILELPKSAESPEVVGGLPNYYHPSDHLPIGAEFEIKFASSFKGKLDE